MHHRSSPMNQAQRMLFDFFCKQYEDELLLNFIKPEWPKSKGISSAGFHSTFVDEPSTEILKKGGKKDTTNCGKACCRKDSKRPKVCKQPTAVINCEQKSNNQHPISLPANLKIQKNKANQF